jgi:hypothetical protein
MTPTALLATAAGALAAWRAGVGGAADPRVARADAIRTAGAVLWPAALFALIDAHDRACPAMAAPLLWPLAVWAVDRHLLHHGTAAAPAGAPAGAPLPTLRLEPASVTALAFGVSGLAGARADSRYAHLFLLAVLGCVTVVLPSHNLAPDSPEAVVIDSVQRVALTWCVGLMLAGAVATRALCARAPPAEA